MYGYAYLRLPAEAAYLIPIIPFLLLLFGLRLKAIWFCVFCTILCASPFFIHLVKDPRNVYIDSGSTFAKYVNRISIKGPALYNLQLREKQVSSIESAFTAIQRMKEAHIMIVAGGYHEYLRAMAPILNKSKELQIVEAFDQNAVRDALARGDGVMVMRGYDNAFMLGYSMSLDSSGNMIPSVAFLLREDRDGKLVSELPTDLDLSLVVSHLGLEEYNRYIKLWSQTHVFVPIKNDGTPSFVMYNGNETLAVFDRMDRTSNLDKLGFNGKSEMMTVPELLDSLPSGVNVALNFGCGTERVFTSAELKTVYYPPAASVH
jgi:hypothetical protein